MAREFLSRDMLEKPVRIVRGAFDQVGMIPVMASLEMVRLTVVAATSTWSTKGVHDELYGLACKYLMKLVLLQRVSS